MAAPGGNWTATDAAGKLLGGDAGSPARPAGTALSAPEGTFGSSDTATDVVASTITLYPSDKSEQHLGRLIATSPDFIFYAVKGAHH